MSLNETKLDLLNDIGLKENETFPNLDLMAEGETRFLKDLRINLKNSLGSENLNPKEAYLIAAAIAANESHKQLTNAFINHAKQNGANESERVLQIYS